MPTLQQRKNLAKLARYLEKFRPTKNRRFDMREYSDHTHLFRTNTCGRRGCAGGFGPYAGIDKRENEYWLDYIKRAFGARMFGGGIHQEIWDTCFDMDLAAIDNTAAGAAKRIRAYLKSTTKRKAKR